MSTLPSGKYQLKTLHEEISLFDRKLAHLRNYESFPSDAERDAAADKLAAKRNLLVRRAQQMIDEGIEFSELERPKSLSSDDAPVAAKKAVATAEPTAEPKTATATIESVPSPFEGTSLDYRADLLAYKKSKARQKTA
jgi:hypothetical protein